MSNETGESLDDILGQLEDELSQIDSARQQVDNVLMANAELKELALQSEAQTKTAAEALATEANRLAGLSETIETTSSDAVKAIRDQGSEAQATLLKTADCAAEKLVSEAGQLVELSKATNQAASDTLEAVRKQAADAQVALSDAADAAVEKLTMEASQLVELSRTTSQAASETLETVQKQAADAQATLEQAADSAVDRATSSISEHAKNTVTSFYESIDDAKSGLNAAVELLGTVASDAKEGNKALLEAHETARNENEQRVAEARLLIEETKQQVAEIDQKIALLMGFNIEELIKEVKGLRAVEDTNSAALQKQMKTITVMLAVCILVCFAVLIRLLVA